MLHRRPTTRARRQPHRRLNPHQIIPFTRAHNRPIRLTPQRSRRQPNRTANPTPRARPARVRVREIWARRLPPTPGEPRRYVPAEVRPLAEVRLAEEYSTGAPQSGCDACVSRDDGTEEGEGASGGIHAVTSFRGDVVLEDDWDAVQRTARTCQLSFLVELSGLLERTWVHFNNSAKYWTLKVDFFNACKIGLCKDHIIFLVTFNVLVE